MVGGGLVDAADLLSVMEKKLAFRDKPAIQTTDRVAVEERAGSCPDHWCSDRLQGRCEGYLARCRDVGFRTVASALWGEC